MCLLFMTEKSKRKNLMRRKMADENVFLKEATRSWGILGIHILISAFILAAALAVTFFIGFGKSPRSVQNVSEIIPTVETEIARQEMNGVTFQVDGVVIPFRKVAVTSEVAGNITFLAQNCRIGRYVQKGDILAEVDRRDYQYAFEEAKQSLIKAEREIEEWKVAVENNQERLKITQEQFDTQKQETERCRTLYQKGAVSQSEMETAMLNLLTRKETVVTLTNESRTLEAQEERWIANRDLAKVEVGKAELNLERCTVYAPLTGLVVGLDVEQDKFIQRGESLVTIHDTSRLEVQCSLYMKQVEWLWSENRNDEDAQNPLPNQNTEQVTRVTREKISNETANEVTESGMPEEESDSAVLRHFYQFDDTPVVLHYELNGVIYQWRGTLTYLDGPGLDSRTRMMPCRVVVDDPLDVEAFTADGRKLQKSVSPTLMPGMFVTVEIHAQPARRLLNLSEMALLPGGTVWKIGKNEEGRDILVRASNIMTAHFDTKTGRVLVYAKRGILEPGDQVIVSPLASPVEGTFVNIKDTDLKEENGTVKLDLSQDREVTEKKVSASDSKLISGIEAAPESEKVLEAGSSAENSKEPGKAPGKEEMP